MSEGVSSASSAQSTPTGKWVPRWKQNPNALPSVPLYSEKQIQERIPGEKRSHTFTRALLGSPDTPASGDPLDNEVHESPVEPPLSDEFCRIMVHDKAHIKPPHELWTRNNFEQIDLNIGRPLPLFQESIGKMHTFEFLGWYHIVRWSRCKGGGEEVLDFVQKRKMSHASRTREYWDHALHDDWARVILEKLNDVTLKNPMEITK